MMRLLAVDDSRVETQCVQFLVRKHGLPVEVDVASNGCEALERMAGQRFDILLTDIKMPRMDGIELARQARNRDEDIVIILLSGYSEFEYAHSAITLGVTEYLLKPLEESRFVETLERVLGRLAARDENRMFARRHLLYRLLNSVHPVDAQGLLSDYAHVVLISFRRDFFNREGEDFETWLGDLAPGGDFVVPNPNEALLFLPEGSAQTVEAVQSALADMLRSHTGEPFVISHRSPAPLSRISVLYQELSQAAQGDGPERTRFPLNECLNAIHQGDYQLLALCYDVFRSAVLEGCGYSAVYTRYALSRMLVELGEALGLDVPDSAVVAEVFGARDFGVLDDIIRRYLKRVGPASAGAAPQRSDEIRRYIDQNFAMALSLDQIAARFYLSPNYLCRLFKQETGVTLLKYINDTRMKKARELLRTTQMKIGQVATAVGYRSASYFTQSFRSAYGITPEVYRAGACATALGEEESP